MHWKLNKNFNVANFVYYGKARQELPINSRSEMHNSEGKFTAWGIGKRKLQIVWRKILLTKQKQIISRLIFKLSVKERFSTYIQICSVQTR